MSKEQKIKADLVIENNGSVSLVYICPHCGKQEKIGSPRTMKAYKGAREIERSGETMCGQQVTVVWAKESE